MGERLGGEREIDLRRLLAGLGEREKLLRRLGGGDLERLGERDIDRLNRRGEGDRLPPRPRNPPLPRYPPPLRGGLRLRRPRYGLGELGRRGKGTWVIWMTLPSIWPPFIASIALSAS